MRATGWTLFAVAIGAMLGLLGMEISQFDTFGQAMTPQFIGKTMMHLSTVIAAFAGGKIIPEPRPVWTDAQRQASAQAPRVS